MDIKHLSDSELAKNTEFADADSDGRRRNISAESYLTGKNNLRWTRDGSTNDYNQRDDEISTFGRNPDVCPSRTPKDQSCIEISSPTLLPTEIDSTFNEFILTENPKQDGNISDIEDFTWISDFGQNSNSRKTDLQISIVDSVKDSDESSDSMIGDFIMDLSPIERKSENIFFEPDKPDGVNSSSDNYDNLLMDETSKVQDCIHSATGEKGRGPSPRDSIRSPNHKKANQDTEEINMQEQLKEIPKDDEGVGESTRPEMSSPYSAFEDNAGVGDSIIGQPRCVALKQHGFVNLDPLEELDFDFEFIEDEPKDEGGKHEKKDLEDMFQDDDDSKEVLKHSSAEIEEGELTPEVHSSSQQQVEGKESDSKRKNLVESNLDLFSKVNRCFFQLDKEFNNIRVPRNCKKLIGQLQDTLKIVRRMDRKLSVLIDSVNKKDRRASRITCEPRNSSKDKGSYDVPLGKKCDDKFNSPDSRSRERRRDRSKSNKCEEQSKSKRRSKDKDSEESRSTRKSTPSEGKKEKQRIQSLFKRQMSLITRHVIQRNRDMKKREVKPGKFPNKDVSINRDESEKVKDLSEMKTLEDMEAFLQRLKEKKHRKPDRSGFRDQGGLKFTTKKTTNSEWRAILEKAREETKRKMAASVLPCVIPAEKETPSRNSVEIKENARKMDEETSKKGKELGAENSFEELMVKNDSNKPLDAVETETANLSTLKNSEEQRCENGTKEREKERSAERVELQNGEKVNDSRSVKRKNSEEIGSIQESRISDFESDSRGISRKKSIRKRTKKRKHSKLKSSESDSSESKDQIPPKKRKRARSKLPPTPSISSKRYHSAAEEIDYFENRSGGELNPQNLFIVADKNLSLLDKHFYLAVKGNQIFLATKDSDDEEAIRRRRKNKRRSRKEEGTTLKEMEDFLQRLRSKKASAQDRTASPSSLHQESKFLARIQAKRKAKLMACISGATSITEKEAKVLKDLETRAREPCDSPETLRKMQKLLQKIRADTEAIVTSHQKKMDDEPVRTLLTTMEEEEVKPQILVSFPLKKSDNKQGVGEGKAQALSEESQKFLNSVRAKIRAKKTTRKAVGDGSDLMKQ